METLLTRQAAQAYRQGEYAAALKLYRQLADKLGEKYFRVNLLLCEKKLEAATSTAPGAGQSQSIVLAGQYAKMPAGAARQPKAETVAPPEAAPLTLLAGKNALSPAPTQVPALGEELVITTQSSELPYVFQGGHSYRLAGRLQDIPSGAKNPALLQFFFEQADDVAAIKLASGLGHSPTVGFYCYLQPLNEQGDFEASFKIPQTPKLVSVSIRTWGLKTAARIAKGLEIKVTDRASTVDEQFKARMSQVLASQRLAEARRAVLAGNAQDPVVQADQLEALFNLAGDGDEALSQDLLLQSFQLDSSYARGKRLAAQGVARGMLAAPASIYASILDDPACTPQDKRAMRRVVSQEKMRREPMAIPPKARRTPYAPDPRTSLFFFYACLPYQSNGYATRTHGICAALQNGNRKALAFSRPGYPWDIKTTVPVADYDDVDGVTYRHLGGANLFTQELDAWVDTASNIVEALARTHRAAVLHAASNWVNALPVLLAARRLGIPFVYEVRGLWEITRESKVGFDWTQSDLYDLDVRHEVLVAREADRVVPITHGLKDELIRRGAEGGKMVVAPNGVNLQDFETRQPDMNLAKRLGLHQAPTIGYVGSFVQYEGLDDLIHAAQRLKQMGKRFNLLLVGDGDEFEGLKRLVAELDLNRQVFLTGRVPHQDVAAYYSLIDIAPFPRKPLKVCELVSPLKPFEAMAMGKTVLVSDVAAMAEFIEDGVNGFSFAKGSVEAMTERLATLMDSPETLKTVGQRARVWVAEHRTWAHAARLIVQLHESLSAA